MLTQLQTLVWQQTNSDQDANIQPRHTSNHMRNKSEHPNEAPFDVMQLQFNLEGMHEEDVG